MSDTIGSSWPILAHLGPSWPFLAHLGPSWLDKVFRVTDMTRLDFNRNSFTDFATLFCFLTCLTKRAFTCVYWNKIVTPSLLNPQASLANHASPLFYSPKHGLLPANANAIQILTLQICN